MAANISHCYAISITITITNGDKKSSLNELNVFKSSPLQMRLRCDDHGAEG